MRSSSTRHETTKLESPIDGMYLLHKALKAQAIELTKTVEGIGGKLSERTSLQPVRIAFDTWAAFLAYHAEVEDKHMTSSMQGLKVMKDNQASHQLLERRMEEVFKGLYDEIGRQSLTGQTWRHLYLHVIALRIAQNDHLDEEEEFVLPILRERTTEAEQLDVMKHLFLDKSAGDERWIVDLTSRYLTEGERGLLSSSLGL